MPERTYKTGERQRFYKNLLPAVALFLALTLMSSTAGAQVTPPALSENADNLAAESVVRQKVETEGSEALTEEETADREFQKEAKKYLDEQERQRDFSFGVAKRQLLPMSPEQIRDFLQFFEESRKASETVEPIPQPEVHIETLSLDPGVTPPVIKTAVGHVTTLTVLDISGAPWPIQDISWGGEFNVIIPESGGHIVRISPLTAHGIGNISMRLAELETPITFSLRTNPDVVHYRFDARIPKFGPLANAPLIDNGNLTAVAGDEILTMVLDGIAPEGAKSLEVTGVDGRTKAWEVSKQIFVRTPLTLLSPAWEKSVSSVDGMKVYALNQAPVLLFSDSGKIVKAQIGTDEAKK